MDASTLPPGWLGPNGPVAELVKKIGFDPNGLRFKKGPSDDIKFADEINFDAFKTLRSYLALMEEEHERAAKAGVSAATVLMLDDLTAPYWAHPDVPDDPIPLNPHVVRTTSTKASDHSTRRSYRPSRPSTSRSSTTLPTSRRWSRCNA
jgi:hypothetical protein